MALAVSYPTQTRNSRTDLVYDIPGLPPIPTKNVEGLPQVRPGQNIPLSNAEWFDWVPKMEAHRIERFEATITRSRSQKDEQSREIARICQDERYWINTYATIFSAETAEEPDDLADDDEDIETAEFKSNVGLGPFILYPFQDYTISFLKQAFRTGSLQPDVLILKSREMGATNLITQVMNYRWLTWGSPVWGYPGASQRKIDHMRGQPFLGVALSRTEEDVDNTADPGTVFWKMDASLKSQPRWLMDAFVPGFDWSQHRRSLTIENPFSSGMMKGGSTNPSFGRGKRGFMALLDEFTYIPRLDAMWQGLRATVKHRVASGTASTQEGTAALKLFMDKRCANLELYTDRGIHPRQDEAWRDAQRRRGSDAEWAQEAGGDWFAMQSDQVYPDAKKKVQGDFPWVPMGGPVFCAIDDGNHWAMWFIQYVASRGRFHVIDFYRNSGKRTEFYGNMLRGHYKDGYSYEEHEHAIIDLVQKMPIDYFMGDTHGAHVEQISQDSVITYLAREHGIILNIDYMKNEYDARMRSLDDVMPFLDFNDTPRVTQGLYSLANYKFRPTPEGREVAREQRLPLHNDNSHAATALEFWANLVKQFLGVYAGGKIVYEGATV
jgi:hypothetical protein